VKPGAEAPAGGSVARSRLAAAWRDPTTVVIAATTVLALGLRIYELSLPGYLFGLTEYDDGSYFGSAVHLVGGVLPYRDFIFVQPPGILLLMAPVALVAKVTGTAAGMAIGRVLTMLASAAGVVLVGLLVRHRGALAALIACGVLAVFPAAIAAAHTVLVEPWLVLFCLLGAVAVFDRDRLTASGRRLAWGGAAFGFAGAVEAWAVIPVLVVTVLCLPRLRRALTFVAGVAAAFLIAVLPFAALAPRRFYQSLITAQVGHRAAALRVPIWARLHEMTGLSHLHLPAEVNLLIARTRLPPHTTLLQLTIVLLLLTVGMEIVLVLATRRPPTALEWFALASTALIVAMFLWPTQFHYHFAAFLAPFLGLAIALPASRLLASGEGSGAGGAPDGYGIRHPVARVAAALAAIVLVLFTVVQVRAEGQLKAVILPTGPGSVAAFGRAIPPGSCVATDEVSLLILANRFVSDVPGCSVMVDGTGTDLALSGGGTAGTGAGRSPAVAAEWRQAFTHAQYVWLSVNNRVRIAWTPALQAYFASHFAPVLTDARGDTLYRRQRSGG
jgi:4-amino-4-deoxy-L-arabinose transferase-like glycosyltransferase